MDDRPIGIFDSGVGGVSVLRALTDVLANERFIYYGDTKNAPYGDRSEREIRALVRNVADHMIAQGIKALVIACNTATSAAAADLRSTLAIPVIGMEPALKPASLTHEGGKILVMATAATLKQEKFHRLMERYGQDAIMLPCPGLMLFVEKGDLGSAQLSDYLDEKFAPYRGEPIDAVVLGCTHYVFLREIIAQKLPKAQLFDGNIGTARRLESVLRAADLLSNGPGGVTFDASNPDSVEIMRQLFRLPRKI